MNKFLAYLLFVDPAKNCFAGSIKHCYAMKSGARLPYCNRACGLPETSLQEIVQTINYFGTIPFRWFVADSDKDQIEKLEHACLEHVGGFPVMHIDLAAVHEQSYGLGIHGKEMTTAEEQATWLSVVSQAYGVVPQEFSVFMTYLLQSTSSGVIKLYCGFYEGIPVAASMIIQHDDVVSVHWVGTMPEFRGKGVGYAVSHKPLIEAKSCGCTQAVLFASEMGKPLYEKIGFREYAYYKVFGRK